MFECNASQADDDDVTDTLINKSTPAHDTFVNISVPSSDTAPPAGATQARTAGDDHDARDVTTPIVTGTPERAQTPLEGSERTMRFCRLIHSITSINFMFMSNMYAALVFLDRNDALVDWF